MSAMPAQPLAAPARPFRRGRVVLAIATVVVVLAAGTRAALAIRRPSLTPERKAAAA